MRQLALELGSAPPPTFANFVIGRNEEAILRLRSLAESRTDERFVYLWGPPASGRTHLLKATVAAFVDRGQRAAYVGCGSGSPFAAHLAKAHCIAVDDVQALDETGQIALFNVYNTLRERGATLLAAGDVPPMRLALRPDLVTRLGWGLVYQIHPLTDEEKARALSAHAQARGFALGTEMCDYLLHHVRRDMPALLAVVDALDRYSLEMKRPVTLPLLREMLRPAPDASGPGKTD